MNYFKPFKAHYGHQAGDTCLRTVAQALYGSLQREGDFVARYGGEESVAVLDCGREGALLMVERMRQRIESLQIPHVYSKSISVVTASFGVATTENAQVKNAEQLLAYANKALYGAKTGRRNRVHAAEPASEVASVQSEK